MKQTICVISDLHIPFEHPDTLAFLKAVKRKYKPTDIIQIGDELDYHDLSFHSSNKDLPSAGDELGQALVKLKHYYRLFPKVTLLESNHGSMVLRKALANGIPTHAIKSYNDILGAPKGWVWKPDLILKTPLGPVYFTHGKSGTPGKLASQYGISCVQGHYHSMSHITYIATPGKLIFDAHTGCLVDDKSLAMEYNKLTAKRPIISILLIIEGIPKIVPMILLKNGRWNGLLC